MTGLSVKNRNEPASQSNEPIGNPNEPISNPNEPIAKSNDVMKKSNEPTRKSHGSGSKSAQKRGAAAANPLILREAGIGKNFFKKFLHQLLDNDNNGNGREGTVHIALRLSHH